MSWEWDFARFGTALLAGVLLSFSGSLVQLTSRNELASPSTLGMDGLAVLCVMLAVMMENLGFEYLPLSQSAFLIGFIFVVVFLFLVKKIKIQNDFKIVLLLGLGLNLFVGALFAFMQFMAMAFNKEFPEQLWFGRMQSLDVVSSLLGLLAFIPIIIFLIFNRRHWKALLLGPGWCRGLGIPVDNILRQSLIISFLATLWVVTHFGVFSFLGLLFPLVLRFLPRYHAHPWREMTDGAIAAGFFFALLDHICFNFTFHGAEIPVGLPSGVLGAAALVSVLILRAVKTSR
ncbi:MAG: iron chelate uptake ABC transporter family permease subunit [Bacteriovoracaceae bacterium]|nr:iron chelate uptake ABC transporter family permease subunit [Bacteriovoracaceae bacterium]